MHNEYKYDLFTRDWKFTSICGAKAKVSIRVILESNDRNSRKSNIYEQHNKDCGNLQTISYSVNVLLRYYTTACIWSIKPKNNLMKITALYIFTHNTAFLQVN